MAYTSELPASAKRLAVSGKKPRVGYGENSFTATDEWYVGFADLTRFLQVVGGTVEDIGGVIQRIVPLRFHDYIFAIAHDCNCEYVGWDSASNTWKGALARIEYRTPTYKVEGSDAFMSRSTSVGQRAMALPPSVTGLSYSTTLPVDTTIINYTLHNLAVFPVEAHAAYGGYANSTAWRNYATGTVRFVGPQSNETVNVAGTKTYEATYAFEFCRIPWTQEYNDSGSLVTLSYPPTANFASVLGF